MPSTRRSIHSGPSVCRGLAHRATCPREDVSCRSRCANGAVLCATTPTKCGSRLRGSAPAVVKTAAFGYDGKGQHKVTTPADVEHIWTAVGHQEAVVEKFINLQAEISVVAARGMDGAIVQYQPFENRHRNHPRSDDRPAAISPAVANQASEITRTILEELQYVGVLCVEFFLSTEGELLVNELAPRPHNSGHLTFDFAITSQFEQQVRTMRFAA